MRIRPAQPAGEPGSDTRSTRREWFGTTPDTSCKDKPWGNVLNGPLRGMFEAGFESVWNGVLSGKLGDVPGDVLRGKLQVEAARTTAAWGAKNSTTA